LGIPENFKKVFFKKFDENFVKSDLHEIWAQHYYFK